MALPTPPTLTSTSTTTTAVSIPSASSTVPTHTILGRSSRTAALPPAPSPPAISPPVYSPDSTPDTAIVSIPALPSTSQKARLKLFPNPCSGNTLCVEVEGYDKNFDLLFFDANGKNVLQMNNIKSGDTFTHTLAPGSYVAIIQNKFISLQTQIIVQ